MFNLNKMAQSKILWLEVRNSHLPKLDVSDQCVPVRVRGLLTQWHTLHPSGHHDSWYRGRGSQTSVVTINIYMLRDSFISCHQIDMMKCGWLNDVEYIEHLLMIWWWPGPIRPRSWTVLSKVMAAGGRALTLASVGPGWRVEDGVTPGPRLQRQSPLLRQPAPGTPSQSCPRHRPSGIPEVWHYLILSSRLLSAGG